MGVLLRTWLLESLRQNPGSLTATGVLECFDLAQGLRAECSVELAHQTALATSNVVLVKNVLAVGAIQHCDGAADCIRCNVLIASGDCKRASPACGWRNGMVG